MSNRLQDDTDCIAAWRGFIGRFNGVLEKDSKDADKLNEMEAIKKEASIKNALNYRQTDAIISRVDNLLGGTYGNTKAGVIFKGA